VRKVTVEIQPELEGTTIIFRLKSGRKERFFLDSHNPGLIQREIANYMKRRRFNEKD